MIIYNTELKSSNSISSQCPTKKGRSLRSQGAKRGGRYSLTKENKFFLKSLGLQLKNGQRKHFKR